MTTTLERTPGLSVARGGKTYAGSRQPGSSGPGTVKVHDGAKWTPLDPRFDLRCHSPDGFQWGYAGSGPAQLALALVADATGDDALALRVYQAFKLEIVVGMADQWMLDAENIATFARTLDRVVPL